MFKVFEKKGLNATYLMLDESKDVDSAVDLIVVDRDGEEIDDGLILTITGNGTLTLQEGLDESLGFKIDKKKRIRVEDE